MRRASVRVDFTKAYWTPPLTPLAAFRLELDQMQRVLGLRGLVSLTDHDNIDAPMLLRGLAETQNVPVSTEWSVCYGGAVLHLGIHNLPAATAESTMEQFVQYTKSPTDQRLRELLSMLHQNREILIVLNHPMWDLKGIGRPRHERAVRDFVADLGTFIHGFELSGVRSWEENRRVVEFAQAWDQVLVGGGDRHGAEPNAVLNLTETETFSEFVDEVRRAKRSHVLFMPQYSRPFTLRVFQSLLDVIREYPGHPLGARRWDERVFHPDRDGNMRPLASLWRKPPVFIEAFFALVRLLEITAFREALQTALATPEEEMQFTPTKREEGQLSWGKTYGSRTSQTPSMKSTVWRTPAANLRRSRENLSSPS